MSAYAIDSIHTREAIKQALEATGQKILGSIRLPGGWAVRTDKGILTITNDQSTWEPMP